MRYKGQTRVAPLRWCAGRKKQLSFFAVHAPTSPHLSGSLKKMDNGVAILAINVERKKSRIAALKRARSKVGGMFRPVARRDWIARAICRVRKI